MGRVNNTALLLTADLMTLHLRLTVPEPFKQRTIALRLDGVEIDRLVAMGRKVKPRNAARSRAAIQRSYR